MTATYCKKGLGSSLAAYKAEDNGRLPMSRAIPIVVHFARCSRKVAKNALELSHDGEYHHTSKYANETNFYKIKAALRYIGLQRIATRLPEDWRNMLKPVFCINDFNKRLAALDIVWNKIATNAGCAALSVKNLYYEDYSGDD